MYKELRESYKKLLLNKAECEKWEITVTTENDKKISELLFQSPIQQKKQRKKISLESLTFIVFGRTSLDKLIENGLEERIIKKKETKSKTKNKK